MSKSITLQLNRFARSPRFSVTAVKTQHQTRNMASSDLNIENTNIKTSSGVTLDEHQKTIVGSVLDVGTEDLSLFPPFIDYLAALRRSTVVEEAPTMG